MEKVFQCKNVAGNRLKIFIAPIVAFIVVTVWNLTVFFTSINTILISFLYLYSTNILGRTLN